MHLKTLRMQLRFLLPLVVTLVVAATLAVPLLDQVTLRWFSRDLNSRGLLVANALSDSVAEALASGQTQRLRPLFERSAQDERLVAIGLCSDGDLLLQRTARFPANLDCPRARAIATQTTRSCRTAWRQRARRRARRGRPHGGRARAPGPPTDPDPDWAPGEVDAAVLVTPAPTTATTDTPPLAGRLVLLHDLSFIDRRSQDTRRYLIGLITALGLVIALITVVVAQLSWRGWVKGARADARRRPADAVLAGVRARAGAAGRPSCAAGCATWRTSTAARRAPSASGPPTGCAACC
jgi:hypothetical protein